VTVPTSRTNLLHLKLEATTSSETLVSIHKNRRYHIPEDGSIYDGIKISIYSLDLCFPSSTIPNFAQCIHNHR
jgi:hypothetical protein